MSRKILVGFAIICFIFSTTACTNTKIIEYITENKIDTSTPENEIMKQIPSPSKNEKTNTDYSDEEIYNAFLEAYDFYYAWIYGQYYINPGTLAEHDGIYFAQTNHDEIKTSEQLTDKIRSCFSKSKAYEYINHLQPRDEDGKLYINFKGGVGDNGVEFDSYAIERIDNETFIMTIYLKENYFIEKNTLARVLCVVEDDKLLFDNYTSSSITNNEYVLF